jgi:hypothetical protein
MTSVLNLFSKFATKKTSNRPNENSVSLAEILFVMLDNNKGPMLNLRACMRLLMTSNEMLDFFAKMSTKIQFLDLAYIWAKTKYCKAMRVRFFWNHLQSKRPLVDQQSLHMSIQNYSCRIFSNRNFSCDTDSIANTLVVKTNVGDGNFRLTFELDWLDLKLDIPVKYLCMSRLSNNKIITDNCIEKLCIKEFSSPVDKLAELNVAHLKIHLRWTVDLTPTLNSPGHSTSLLLPSQLVSLILYSGSRFCENFLSNVTFPKTLLWLSLLGEHTNTESNIKKCVLPEKLEVLVTKSFRKHRALRKIYTYDPNMHAYKRKANAFTVMDSEYSRTYGLDTSLLPSGLKAYHSAGDFTGWSEDGVPAGFFEKMEYLSVNVGWLDALDQIKFFPNIVTLSFANPINSMLQINLFKMISERCPNIKQLFFCPLIEFPEQIINLPNVQEIYVSPETRFGQNYFAPNSTLMLRYLLGEKSNTVQHLSDAEAPIDTLRYLYVAYTDQILGRKKAKKSDADPNVRFQSTVELHNQSLFYNYYIVKLTHEPFKVQLINVTK